MLASSCVPCPTLFRSVEGGQNAGARALVPYIGAKPHAARPDTLCDAVPLSRRDPRRASEVANSQAGARGASREHLERRLPARRRLCPATEWNDHPHGPAPPDQGGRGGPAAFPHCPGGAAPETRRGHDYWPIAQGRGVREEK